MDLTPHHGACACKGNGVAHLDRAGVDRALSGNGDGTFGGVLEVEHGTGGNFRGFGHCCGLIARLTGARVGRLDGAGAWGTVAGVGGVRLAGFGVGAVAGFGGGGSCLAHGFA